MIKDSGNRTEFKSGAVRDIQEGKGRCDLLPLDIIDLWCDDGLQGTLYYVGEYLKAKGTTDYFELVLNEFAIEHQAKRIASGENVQNKLYSTEEYRWNLVLELAKHFEDGAKKYGDRNWEKGIPCDRYIDSAVRHYCKWRAGWDDEPHDRAFIWNILCCEWTRQRYGWNLERLETAKKYENILGMKTELLDHKGLMSGTLRSVASSFNNKKRFTRSACLYLYDRHGQPAGRVWILNAYKSANLYAVIGNVWKESNDVTLKILEAELSKHEWKPGVDFVVESFDKEDSESKTFAKIGEQMSQALNDCVNMVDNPYVKGMDDGWKFYSVDGRLLGYIFKFEEPSEQKRRQLDIMVKKVWHEVTDNVYTMKRIIEERGYTCDRDFSICIAPSEIAKEYDFKNRKYNEED